METSRKTVTRHWFKFFGVMLLFDLIRLVSAITIIGFGWACKVTLACSDVLPHATFDVEETRG